MDWLWPKEHSPGNYDNKLREILEGIDISKIGSILKLVEDVEIKSSEKVDME